MKEALMQFVGLIISYGDVGLFVLAFIESSFFPIPPDVVLITMCLANPVMSLWYAALCSVGSVLGGGFGYLIGRYGGRPIAIKIFSDEKINLVERYYDKYGVFAVGVAGFTPIPYKVFTVTSGMFRLSFIKFILISFISRSARFFMVGGAIYLWGEEMKIYILKYLNVISILFVVLLLGGFYLMHLFAKRKGEIGV